MRADSYRYQNERIDDLKVDDDLDQRIESLPNESNVSKLRSPMRSPPLPPPFTSSFPMFQRNLSHQNNIESLLFKQVDYSSNKSETNSSKNSTRV